MNLIKILCGILALALLLGILTAGDSDNSGPEELESVTEKTAGTQNTEEAEKNGEMNSLSGKENGEMNSLSEKENGETNSLPDNFSESINTVIPEPPDPSLLENGSDEIAFRKRLIKSRIRTAAGLIEENGEEIFSEFREEGSSWFYGDFYIFVGSLDGTLVVYPPNGSKEGINLKGLQDSDGKPIGELFLETGLSEAGEGWVYYNWPEPGSSEPSKKYTFIKRAPGKEQTYFIGTGFYPEECIISRNLVECEILEREGNTKVSELFNPDDFERKPDLECSISYSTLGVGGSIASYLVETPGAHYVLEGKGVLYLNDIPVELLPGQLVYVPAGSFQTVYNTGNTSLLLLSVNRSVPDEEKAINPN